MEARRMMLMNKRTLVDQWLGRRISPRRETPGSPMLGCEPCNGWLMGDSSSAVSSSAWRSRVSSVDSRASVGSGRLGIATAEFWDEEGIATAERRGTLGTLAVSDRACIPSIIGPHCWMLKETGGC